MQVIENITLPQVFFKHFARKNQLPGFYISGTLVENRSGCTYQSHIIGKRECLAKVINFCNFVLLVVTCCHSLLLVFIHCTTRCHALSLVVPLTVIWSHLLYHWLPLLVIRCHSSYQSLSLLVTSCHSLSLVVTGCITRLYQLAEDVLL